MVARRNGRNAPWRFLFGSFSFAPLASKEKECGLKVNQGSDRGNPTCGFPLFNGPRTIENSPFGRFLTMGVFRPSRRATKDPVLGTRKPFEKGLTENLPASVAVSDAKTFPAVEP
ncbi:MAG: hypothetical protein IJX94_00655 [Clostridia bacterium]|nr:hypothetical protein [Clostridia bacterium]